MTLSPVFRSPDAVAALESKGFLRRLEPSLQAERAYVALLHKLLPQTIDQRYLSPAEPAVDDVTFLQDHFFLTLFDSVFRSLGCPANRLEIYGPLNLCVKGLIVAGDNLFDREAKMELPLALGSGPFFASIMQLLCFDHLLMNILERQQVEQADVVRYRRELLGELAAIGTLEGSEEGGVDEVLPIEDMIRQVHEVRGGRLFSLAFIAPCIWEPADQQERWEKARRGIWRLGTAFQIVDDLTDFEFDLRRRSHNALSAQIVHQGTPAEKRAYERLAADPEGSGVSVEKDLVASAKAVLERARIEAQRGFEELAQVGFWFPPAEAGLFVRAIAGDAGDERIDAVTGRSSVSTTR